MKKDERLNFSDRTPSVRRLVVSLVLMLLAALPRVSFFRAMIPQKRLERLGFEQKTPKLS